MNQFVSFDQLGGPEVLNVAEAKIPEPASHELVVKVNFAGLNQAELLFFQGQYLFQPKFPSKVGLEASGIVEKVGSGVFQYHIGDAVCLTPNIIPYAYGYIGEYVKVPQEAVIPKPDTLSMAEAAAFWMNYGTAYAGLVMRGGLLTGTTKTVLITAASSGVGLAAIQLAKYLGARVIATTRSDEKFPLLMRQGADHVINSNSVGFSESILDLTDGAGFQLGFDPVGGQTLFELANAAGTEAHIVLYGLLSRQPEAPFPMYPTFMKGLKYSGVHLVFHLLQHQDRFKTMQDMLLQGLREEAFRPVIDRYFELDQVSEAYQFMQSNQQMGKILITMSE